MEVKFWPEENEAREYETENNWWICPVCHQNTTTTLYSDIFELEYAERKEGRTLTFKCENCETEFELLNYEYLKDEISAEVKVLSK